MIRVLASLFIIICTCFSISVSAEEWQAVIMPDRTSVKLDNDSRNVIEDMLIRNFSEVSINVISPAVLLSHCDDSLCEALPLRVLLSAFEKKQGLSNLLILYKVSHFKRAGQGKTTLQIKAIDPLSGALSFTNLSSTQFYELHTQDANDGALGPELEGLDFQLLKELVERGSQELAMQISLSKKRYKYQLKLVGFTPDEVNIFSGIAMSITDNVKAALIKEETELHFLNLFLPTRTIQFELSTVVSPSQFREQMSRLFKRMDVNVRSKFIQQENLFETTRAQSPYTLQLFLMWSFVIIFILATCLVAFWSWVQFKLNLYESGNQSEKWVGLVRTLLLFPFPFFCKEKWREQLPYWEKRVSQADIWYDNAHQLLQNHEIESANVFVKKSLEVNASNIAAQALESAIAEQLSKHQVIDDEREKFKGLVTGAVEMAQAGKLFKALEKAYLALALSQSHESHNRPVIDLQIDSTKNLIKRISANKSHRCAGLKLISSYQRVHINCGDLLRIGRSQKSKDNEQNLDLTLPLDTLSRVNKSIVVARDEQGFSARDTGSTNGLWLQYKKCEADKAYYLTQMDQLHLTPPDEIGGVGIQVSQIAANQSICLRLCQNAIMPTINLKSSNSFINPSEYAKDYWYLSKEAFYLVCSSEDYIWYCESEWKATKTQQETSSPSEEVLKIDMKDGAWLHISSTKYEVEIDGNRIIGPVPLPMNSQLSVNDYLVDIVLIPEQVVDSEVTEMLRV